MTYLNTLLAVLGFTIFGPMMYGTVVSHIGCFTKGMDLSSVDNVVRITLKIAPEQVNALK